MTNNLRNDVRPLEALARFGVKEYRTWCPIDTMRPSEMIGTEQYGYADLGFCKAVSARRRMVGDLAIQRITGVISFVILGAVLIALCAPVTLITRRAARTATNARWKIP